MSSPGPPWRRLYLMPASRRRWSLPLCVARQARAGARRPRFPRARPWCASRGGLPRWPGCGAFIAACSSSRSRASSRPDSAPRPPAVVGRPVSRSKAAMGERRSAVVYACRALAEVGDFGVSALASRSGRRRRLMRQRRVTDAPRLSEGVIVSTSAPVSAAPARTPPSPEGGRALLRPPWPPEPTRLAGDMNSPPLAGWLRRPARPRLPVPPVPGHPGTRATRLRFWRQAARSPSPMSSPPMPPWARLRLSGVRTGQ
jgi:hypothetical protein